MGVGIQREPSGEVAEHTGYSFYVNSVLQRNGSKGVAEVVKSDLRDACSCQHTLEHIVHAVRRDGASVGGGEDVFVIGFLFLLFQNFYRLL